MKSAQDIQTKAGLILELIMNCQVGCSGKPTKYYCQNCHVLRHRYEELEWVIEEEGQLRRMINNARIKEAEKTRPMFDYKKTHE